MNLKNTQLLISSLLATLLPVSLINPTVLFAQETDWEETGKSTETGTTLDFATTDQEMDGTQNGQTKEGPNTLEYTLKDGVLTITGGEIDGDSLQNSGYRTWRDYFDVNSSNNIDFYSVRSIVSDAKVTLSGNMSGLFRNLIDVTTIDIDFSKWDTSKVTNTSHMFDGCVSLQSLNLSNFDTSGVRDMSYMFNECYGLNLLDLNNLDTANVTNMSNMFWNCSKLESLDLCSFNTANVTNMSNMFLHCSGLESLDLSNFNTANVTNMSIMFSNCSNLKSLNLCSFNTVNVTNMSSMFASCSNLRSLDLSNFAISPVTKMESIFYNCNKLTSLDLCNSSIPEDCASTMAKQLNNCCSNNLMIRLGNGADALTNALLSDPDEKWHSAVLPPAAGLTSCYLTRSDQSINIKNWLTPSSIESCQIEYDMTNRKYEKLSVSIDLENSGQFKLPVEITAYLPEGFHFVDSKGENPQTHKIVDLLPGIKGNYFFEIIADDNADPNQTYTIKYSIKADGYEYDSGTFDIQPVIVNRPDSGSSGSSGNASLVQKTDTMYRLYNPNSGEHFYTKEKGEQLILISLGWKEEGTGWKAPKQSDSPVYRLYNPNAGDHHYTMSAQERDHLVSVGWKDEGIGWYSDDKKAVPVYRQYNSNATAGSHNYTTSLSEHNYLVSIGWNDEGIAWYGMK